MSKEKRSKRDSIPSFKEFLQMIDLPTTIEGIREVFEKEILPGCDCPRCNFVRAQESLKDDPEFQRLKEEMDKNGKALSDYIKSKAPVDNNKAEATTEKGDTPTQEFKSRVYDLPFGKLIAINAEVYDEIVDKVNGFFETMDKEYGPEIMQAAAAKRRFDQDEASSDEDECIEDCANCTLDSCVNDEEESFEELFEQLCQDVDYIDEEVEGIAEDTEEIKNTLKQIKEICRDGFGSIQMLAGQLRIMNNASYGVSGSREVYPAIGIAPDSISKKGLKKEIKKRAKKEANRIYSDLRLRFNTLKKELTCVVEEEALGGRIEELIKEIVPQLEETNIQAVCKAEIAKAFQEHMESSKHSE